jgi:CTP synthase (UTP-ammonia lyase)
VRIAVLIDLPAGARFNVATFHALKHAAGALDAHVDARACATDGLPFDVDLDGVDGVVVGPGSPYRDEVAVWSVVRSARERGVPLVGT